MKAKASLYLGVTLCLLLLAIVACTKAPNEAQITSDIQAKINADSGLQGKQLGVQTENGTVTLSGNVDSEAQREAAARYASSEAGVKQVVNNLTVGPGQTAQTAQDASPATRKHREAPKAKKEDGNNSNNDDASGMNGPTQMADQTAPPPPAPAAPAPTAAPAAAPAPPPPPPPPQKITIPSGTALTIRLVDGIDSEKNQTGDTFHATLNGPLTINGDVVVPAGSDAQGHLASVKSAGKFAGQSEVVLQLDSITSGGNTYNIQTDQYTRQGSSRGKNTAEKVGVGAGIGAILGGILGGGKGAAIGAATGGGIGGGVQAATKGQQIKLPSETVLNFTLQAPVTVVATTQGPNSGRPRLNTN